MKIEILKLQEQRRQKIGFMVKAKRKPLRRLQDIAAFNLAQHLVSEAEVESLNIPKTLIPLVKRFLVTYSGSYIIDMNTN